MAVLTIEIPDDLMEQLAPLKEQLPDLLRRCLHPLALPAQVYRSELDFLTSQPTYLSRLPRFGLPMRCSRG